MRLSEAIREGSKGMRPVYGPMTSFEDGKLCGVCAIGAAIRGARGNVLDPFEWKRLFPETRAIAALDCPACNQTHENTRTAAAPVHAVIHLHESHQWTFEQIADWVQAQEAIHGIDVSTEKDTTICVKTPELVSA